DGFGEAEPTSEFESINVPMRGEYSTHLGEAVQLYVSTIDHKLHMYKAEAGVWSVNQRFEKPDTPPIVTDVVRYAALGGPFLNSWEHLNEGVVTQKLLHL